MTPKEPEQRPSYEKINYAVRPSKNIERKMLSEAFSRLSTIVQLKSYRYIGFGSTFFSDFSLFHRSLGIAKMTSIEKDVKNKERFEFNRPFRCIQLAFGKAGTVLPGLPWNQKTILWLDYDGKLTSEVLADVSVFCRSASAGSVIVVSVNAEPGDWHEDLVEQLRQRIGNRKVPTGVGLKDLRNWGTAKVYRRILHNEISELISTRNGPLAEGEKLVYQQLFNFQYADRARMVTVGGILYSERQAARFRRCAFGNLDFIRSGEDAYRIEAPNLTYRELRFLDSHLPLTPGTQVSLPGVPQDDVEKYSRVYRYFPLFAEAEI